MSKYITLALLTTMILNAVTFAADGKESPFVVYGKILDDTGKSLEGVKVNASCGMGSLFHTGTAKTDKAIHDAPFGVRHELESSSFEVSATVESAQKLSLESTGDKHEVRLSLNRQSVVEKN